MHQQINLLLNRLDEQQRRWYAALQAKQLGRGGVQLMSWVTGISEKTIKRGHCELDAELLDRPVGRVRQAGGGRRPVEIQDTQLERSLERLLESETAGNPQGPDKYKRSSLRQLSAKLREQGVTRRVRRRCHGCCASLATRRESMLGARRQAPRPSNATSSSTTLKSSSRRI
nr:hypothetical protein [Caldimonas tepidiphila]